MVGFDQLTTWALHASALVILCPVNLLAQSATIPQQQPKEPAQTEAPSENETQSPKNPDQLELTPAEKATELRLQSSKSRLSDTAIPLQLDDIPERPLPVVELGDPFLGQGEISKGIELPTGAVWTPRLQVFGTMRTALQTFNAGDRTFTDWANRLDIFTNLQLSGTERILFGIRPFDEDGRPFSGYLFTPDDQEGWQNGFDTRVETLFFEGDFGEIFPGLDSDDNGLADFGFSVGRQSVLRQDGLLIDDSIDALGIIRNTLKSGPFTNLRLTGMWGWFDVNRANGFRDKESDLYALFTEADLYESTIALDLVYVNSLGRRGDGFFAAASATQRFGELNTTFRVLTSIAVDEESDFVGNGTLLFAELSLTPHGTEDVLYFDAFWAIDEYTSAARGPDRGGPLGRVGIAYAAVGLGRYGSALSDQSRDAVGFAAGWQQLFDGGRKQLILELAGRMSTDEDEDTGGVALGARWQQAFGQNFILRLDAFGSYIETEGPGFGLRMEWQIKF